MNKALFLDRDGVINEDSGYVYKIDDFRFVHGVFDFCRKMQERGYLIIVITNQSGISRGYFTEQDFSLLNSYMVFKFDEAGVRITDVFHCPSLEGEDRKPNPGMFLKAKETYDIDMAKSVNVGDKKRDLEAGISAKVGVNLLFTGDWSTLLEDVDRAMGV